MAVLAVLAVFVLNVVIVMHAPAPVSVFLASFLVAVAVIVVVNLDFSVSCALVTGCFVLVSS